MSHSQPHHPHLMANRSKSLFGPYAFTPVDAFSSGPGCVHAGFDSTTAALSAPLPAPVADTVMGEGRQNSSSSQETEEGFVVVADEVGAPWDINDTSNQPTPTLVSSAIQSARNTWSSFLPSRLTTTAPSQKPQTSTQDVSTWEIEPPLQDVTGFRARPGPKVPGTAPSSGEATSRRSQAQLTDAEWPGGVFIVVPDQPSDPLDTSVAWQRRSQPGEGSGAEQRKRAAMLEAWKSKQARAGRSGALGPAKEEKEVRVKAQIARRATKMEKLAMSYRTGENRPEEHWIDKMGVAAAGRTMEETKSQVLEEMWGERIRAGPAARERRRAREARDAASCGGGAGL